MRYRYFVLITAFLLFPFAISQSVHGQGRGFRGGRSTPQDDNRRVADQNLVHFLLNNHDKIKRTVKEIPNGVETTTESDDAQVAAKIQEHVRWMKVRVEKSKPIRMRDLLFRELFQHTDKIKMVVKSTDKGVHVTETSNDPYVAKLIQAHAKVVSGFVAKGFAEARQNHSAPSRVEAPNEVPAARKNNPGRENRKK
ncbi:hypothetical protein SV7mr_39170 [Stieleria bergensis]|uniref:Uncharacterized protein n=1 Tax=Stieleria bergensis TaxID=2528025 RepID=A0A517SZ71_9BACT|nr:hypothetical protein SV7mr_39170 [Planctomycetes bacterium SV_7m_r]